MIQHIIEGTSKTVNMGQMKISEIKMIQSSPQKQ